MKPPEAPHVTGKTEWERFDNAVKKAFTVPKSAFVEEQARLKKKKVRGKAKTRG